MGLDMDSTKIIESTKEIYNNLQDDISKRIYTNRMIYNLTDDDTYIRNLFEEWAWEDKLITDIEKFESPVCVYGAGDFGKRLVRYFPELKWHCFVDNNAESIGQIRSLKVCSVDEYLATDLPIIISVKRDCKAIKNMLISRGISADKILCLRDYLSEMDHIYFDFLTPENDEVFADVGGYDGMSSHEFFDWCENKENSIAYIFEPNNDMSEIINANIQPGMNFKIAQYGVWDKKTKLSFMKSSKADECYIVENADEALDTVSVIDLDTYFEKEGVVPTYIKMDIEGAEHKAIEGTKNIIANNKPRLAISIYHKQEDLWDLPKLLLDIRPDYKFYIRHYTMGLADTVLYAV